MKLISNVDLESTKELNARLLLMYEPDMAYDIILMLVSLGTYIACSYPRISYVGEYDVENLEFDIEDENLLRLFKTIVDIKDLVCSLKLESAIKRIGSLDKLLYNINENDIVDSIILFCVKELISYDLNECYNSLINQHFNDKLIKA